MDNNGFVNDANNGRYSTFDSKIENGFSKTNNGTLNNVAYLESVESVQSNTTAQSDKTANSGPERESWGKGVEFLMSCIAMSVGLGNVWRFPFTALENGGGAFLFPYIIVLLVIGRPLYYLEMVIGQFSSRNSINVFDMVPIFRGKFQKNTKIQ